MSPEQREVEQEEGSEGREEGQDSPIACGDDIHLYDNQISPGPGLCTGRRGGLGESGGAESLMGLKMEEGRITQR